MDKYSQVAAKHKEKKRQLKHKEKKRKMFKCEHCDYVSEKKCQLGHHMGVKSNLFSFKCAYCEYSAPFKNCVVHHVKSLHTTMRPYKRPIVIIQPHLKTVFNCQFCDFVTLFPECLTGHVYF